MAPPNAGPRAQSRRYDTRVKVQSPPAANDATTQDIYGRISAAWTTVKTVWAWVEPDAGGELTVGTQTVGAQQYLVGFRRQTDVTIKQRLVIATGLLRGAVLEIQAIAPVGGSRAEGIQASCTRAD